jgi:hypothetical protein
MAKMTTPFLLPVVIAKTEEHNQFLVTLAVWLLQIKMNKRMKITGKFEVSFNHLREEQLKSTTLIMSMAKLNTSEPLFMYQSTVSSTAQVHIVYITWISSSFRAIGWSTSES